MNSKERVLEGCQRLWSSRGLRDFTMDELAAEAGLSKRTVYKYYPSKEAIIVAVVERMMADVAAESDRLFNEGRTPGEIFYHTMDYLFMRTSFLTSKRSLEEMLRYYPHIWQRIHDYRIQRLDHMVTAITGRSTGSTPPGIDVRIAKAVVISAISTILDPHFLLENGLTFQEAASQVFRLLMMMLGYEQAGAVFK